MAEHQRARLLAGAELDGARHLCRDPAEPVHGPHSSALHQLDRAIAGPRTLRDHDDAEAPTRLLTGADLVAHLLDVEWDLGDQDHVRAAGQPAVERDPSGVASHQLDHHDAVVALGSGVHLVERLGRGADGAVEPERALRAGHVVVDRLGDTDDRQSLAPELVRDLEAAVAADRDQGVEAAGLEGSDQVVRAINLRLVAVRVPHHVAKRVARLVVPRIVRRGG